MTSIQTQGILCAIDLEHTSLAAENVAFSLAQALKIPLQLLHVDSELEAVKSYAAYANYFLPLADQQRLHGKLIADKTRALRHRIHAIGAAAINSVTINVIEGEAAHELTSHIKTAQPPFELVVLSKRRRSFFNEFLLGSVAHHLVEGCEIPVLLVPDRDDLAEPWHPNQVVFFNNTKAAGQDLIKYGTKIAQALGCDHEQLNVSQHAHSPVEDIMKKMTAQSGNLLVVASHWQAGRHHHHSDHLTSALARAASFPLLIVPCREGA